MLAYFTVTASIEFANHITGMITCTFLAYQTFPLLFDFNLPGGMVVGVFGEMGEVTGWNGRSGLSCWKDSRLAWAVFSVKESR